jgi:hypothetical protein
MLLMTVMVCDRVVCSCDAGCGDGGRFIDALKNENRSDADLV